ncbi:hypothetical protein PI124_g18362 [Phytophthora idaei]|nr:hypothetical protein PI125_g19069 [Phytophthora idaei]KAG3141717.1 hypothetical protein PI126_g15364 [Phytophthora idaei]KAG3236631.1 hypothetical protein PI124_g18362 [Phytophthora idaei]
MPTTESVVVAVRPSVVPGTAEPGVPVVQSVAATGLLTATTSSTMGAVSVPYAGGQSATNIVQPLQGGSIYGARAVQPPTWVPSEPVPGVQLKSMLPSS